MSGINSIATLAKVAHSLAGSIREDKGTVKNQIKILLTILHNLFKNKDYDKARSEKSIREKIETLKKLLQDVDHAKNRKDLEKIQDQARRAYDYIRERLIMEETSPAPKDIIEDTVDGRADAFGLGLFSTQESIEEQLENIQWLKEVGSPRAIEILKEVATEYGACVKDLDDKVLFSAVAALIELDRAEAKFLLEFMDNHPDSRDAVLDLVSVRDKKKITATKPAPAPKPSIQEQALKHYEKGKEFYKAGKYDKALEFFNGAIALNKDYAAAYSLRGWTNYSLKSYQEAIQDFTQALRLDPTNGSPEWDKSRMNKYQANNYYGRSLAKAKLAKTVSEKKEALKNYKKACELDPDYKKKPAPEVKLPQPIFADDLKARVSDKGLQETANELVKLMQSGEKPSAFLKPGNQPGTLALLLYLLKNDPDKIKEAVKAADPTKIDDLLGSYLNPAYNDISRKLFKLSPGTGTTLETVKKIKQEYLELKEVYTNLTKLAEDLGIALWIQEIGRERLDPEQIIKDKEKDFARYLSLRLVSEKLEDLKKLEDNEKRFAALLADVDLIQENILKVTNEKSRKELARKLYFFVEEEIQVDPGNLELAKKIQKKLTGDLFKDTRELLEKKIKEARTEASTKPAEKVGQSGPRLYRRVAKWWLGSKGTLSFITTQKLFIDKVAKKDKRKIIEAAFVLIFDAFNKEAKYVKDCPNCREGIIKDLLFFANNSFSGSPKRLAKIGTAFRKYVEIRDEIITETNDKREENDSAFVNERCKIMSPTSGGELLDRAIPRLLEYLAKDKAHKFKKALISIIIDKEQRKLFIEALAKDINKAKELLNKQV